MSKTPLVLILNVLFLFFIPSHVHAVEYPMVYEYYLELGKEAVQKKDYPTAMGYFNMAHLLNPSEETPLSLINLTKRLQEGRVEKIIVPQSIRKKQGAFSRKQNSVVSQGGVKTPPRSLSPGEGFHRFPPSLREGQGEGKQRKQVIIKALDSMEAAVTKRKKVSLKPRDEETAVQFLSSGERPVQITPQQKENIRLDEKLRATQPRTFLQVEFNKSVVLEGGDIEKYLSITPGIIDIERIDRDRVKIIGMRRGSTLVHLWEEKGRWTFNVEVIFPLSPGAGTYARDHRDGAKAKSFKFTYSSDWSSYYSGHDIPHLERQSLNFLQVAEVAGETPYGDFDSFGVFNKFQESTEVTGYGVGLTDGYIGTFKDFSIRGYDISKHFSSLSLPGRYFRGVLLESKAFNHNFEYTLLKGRDQVTYGFVAPSVVDERDSFIEGAKVTVFPEGKHQYSFNYARGYGDEREPFLKEKVFSFETQQGFNRSMFGGEAAFDEEDFAKTITSEFKGDWAGLKLNFRDIDQDFTTITGPPPYRGEIGGNALFSWNPSDQIFTSSDLDIYQDRFLPNPDDPDAYNLDWNNSIDVSLSPTASWRTNAGYIDAQGTISPRRNLRTNTTYTKRFSMSKDKTLSVFLGGSYQRSRFRLSPASEYDRYGTTAGFQVPLSKDFSYFANYEYSWVEEILSEDQSNPNVFNTGINYTKKLSKSWSGNSSFSYRNEENTESARSFLAGEDSISGNLGLDYRPNEDFNFFIDGRMRNVWAENSERAAYNEGEIRFGVRSSWDLPFSWNPSGEIAGMVFKDVNGNGQIDKEEEGLKDIVLKVSNLQAVTDEHGKYRIKIRAKKAVIELDPQSIPPGYVSSTSISQQVEIINLTAKTVNFGLTTQSGIYGVVYFDHNGNDQLDADDIVIPKVKMDLDGHKTAVSDFEGMYVFKNVAEGRHVVQLNVNSLPAEYIPKIKLKNTVDISEGTTYVLHVPLRKNTSGN